MPTHLDVQICSTQDTFVDAIDESIAFNDNIFIIKPDGKITMLECQSEDGGQVTTQEVEETSYGWKLTWGLLTKLNNKEFCDECVNEIKEQVIAWEVPKQ